MFWYMYEINILCIVISDSCNNVQFRQEKRRKGQKAEGKEGEAMWLIWQTVLCIILSMSIEEAHIVYLSDDEKEALWFQWQIVIIYKMHFELWLKYMYLCHLTFVIFWLDCPPTKGRFWEIPDIPWCPICSCHGCLNLNRPAKICLLKYL